MDGQAHDSEYSRRSWAAFRKAAEALPTVGPGERIIAEELAAQRFHEKTERAVLKYTDTIGAERYLRFIAEGNRPSPRHYDDPLGDPNSLFLKRALATVKIVTDTIENSSDLRLIDTAKTFLADLEKQVPNTVKWLAAQAKPPASGQS
jgi:hypothetical protein